MALGSKLFVGNLPYGVSDQELVRLFAPHGRVQSAQVVVDRDTGRSRGFAFVEMASESDAQAAVARLNTKQIAGRSLVVREDRPKEPRPRNTAAGASSVRKKRPAALGKLLRRPREERQGQAANPKAPHG
jgi:RNA recognition motif-containing protein